MRPLIIVVVEISVDHSETWPDLINESSKRGWRRRLCQTTALRIIANRKQIGQILQVKKFAWKLYTFLQG